MKNNLDVDHYRNGDSIPQVTDQDEWASLTSGAWCYYINDSANNSVYGKLYNWYAVNDPRGLAPEGCHVPSDSEWTVLVNYLGGEEVAGGRMKEVGYTHWNYPNNGATDESGFTALPGGLRVPEHATFLYVGIQGLWWSSTERNTTLSWSRQINDGSESIYRYTYIRTDGFSVRCIKD